MSKVGTSLLSIRVRFKPFQNRRHPSTFVVPGLQLLHGLNSTEQMSRVQYSSLHDPRWSGYVGHCFELQRCLPCSLSHWQTAMAPVGFDFIYSVFDNIAWCGYSYSRYSSRALFMSDDMPMLHLSKTAATWVRRHHV